MVYAAVDFDDEPGFGDGEINNVASDGMLATDRQAVGAQCA